MYNKNGFGYVAQQVAQCLKRFLGDDKQYKVDLLLASKVYVGSLLSFSILHNVVGVNKDVFNIDEVVDTATEIFLRGLLSED
ncbi:MAG TPA: hypothetical protein GXZ52_03405 [Clostridiales bacterium]|jgi:hypothetical protein|nr:hypothetical protein [Clostridiales bacterium]